MQDNKRQLKACITWSDFKSPQFAIRLLMDRTLIRHLGFVKSPENGMSRSTLCYFQLSEQLIAGGHLIELEDGLMMCVTCGAVKKTGFSKFVEHLETMHHFGSGYPCPFCEKLSWSQSNRQRHIERAHKKTMSFKQIRVMPPFSGWESYFKSAR